MPQLLVYLKVRNLITMKVNEKADKSSKYLVQFAVRCNSYLLPRGTVPEFGRLTEKVTPKMLLYLSFSNERQMSVERSNSLSCRLRRVGCLIIENINRGTT